MLKPFDVVVTKYKYYCDICGCFIARVDYKTVDPGSNYYRCKVCHRDICRNCIHIEFTFADLFPSYAYSGCQYYCKDCREIGDEFIQALTDAEYDAYDVVDFEEKVEAIYQSWRSDVRSEIHNLRNQY